MNVMRLRSKVSTRGRHTEVGCDGAFEGQCRVEVEFAAHVQDEPTWHSLSRGRQGNAGPGRNPRGRHGSTHVAFGTLWAVAHWRTVNPARRRELSGSADEHGALVDHCSDPADPSDTGFASRSCRAGPRSPIGEKLPAEATRPRAALVCRCWKTGEGLTQLLVTTGFLSSVRAQGAVRCRTASRRPWGCRLASPVGLRPVAVRLARTACRPVSVISLRLLGLSPLSRAPSAHTC